MTETELARELHRVADAVPVPVDLFPSNLQARPISRNRFGWVGVAVAVAALLLSLMTPMGARAIAAVEQLITRFSVKVVQTDTPPPVPPSYLVVNSIYPGDTVVKEIPGHSKKVGIGMHLKDLEPGWPTPTYRGPGPEARVVRTEGYRAGTDQILHVSLHVMWQDGDQRLRYELFRLKEPLAPEQYNQLQSGATMTVYTDRDGTTVEEQNVMLKGQPATAMRVGQEQWQLHWVHQYGGGSLSGEVELDELVKIAESLPALQ